MKDKLKKRFFSQDTPKVARQLLGKVLVRESKGCFMKARITETEAYKGTEDTACHASKGKTARTKVMFEDAGTIYVYLIYGMYHMLNVVTEEKGYPAAVLIRGIEPLSGIDTMKMNRGVSRMNIASIGDGPGKLTQALDIDMGLNGKDIIQGDELYILRETIIKNKESIVQYERVGIEYASKSDREKKWRFVLESK